MSKKGYFVPLELPKYCNKCPYGHCMYSYPFWATKRNISKIDGKENKVNTYGYICNLDFAENGKYTKVLRANFDENNEKPNLCKLIEIEVEE